MCDVYQEWCFERRRRRDLLVTGLTEGGGGAIGRIKLDANHQTLTTHIRNWEPTLQTVARLWLCRQGLSNRVGATTSRYKERYGRERSASGDKESVYKAYGHAGIAKGQEVRQCHTGLRERNARQHHENTPIRLP